MRLAQQLRILNAHRWRSTVNLRVSETKRKKNHLTFRVNVCGVGTKNFRSKRLFTELSNRSIVSKPKWPKVYSPLSFSIHPRDQCKSKNIYRLLHERSCLRQATSPVTFVGYPPGPVGRRCGKRQNSSQWQI